MREGHPSEGFRRGEKKIFRTLSLVGLAVFQLLKVNFQLTSLSQPFVYLLVFVSSGEN